MFYVYALISLKNSNFYIGQTNDLERRIRQHNSGKVQSTKAFLPYKLVLKELYKDRNSAVVREKELKSTEGRRYLKKIITGEYA